MNIFSGLFINREGKPRLVVIILVAVLLVYHAVSTYMSFYVSDNFHTLLDLLDYMGYITLVPGLLFLVILGLWASDRVKAHRSLQEAENKLNKFKAELYDKSQSTGQELDSGSGSTEEKEA